jgi:hypothetical protein
LKKARPFSSLVILMRVKRRTVEEKVDLHHRSLLAVAIEDRT